MLRFQETKDSFLFPLVKILLHLNISANSVSVFSGLVAVFSLFFSVLSNIPLIFIIGIWFHLFLDGLDGSIARLSGKKLSANGLLFDLIFDSMGIVMVGLYVLYFNYVSMLAAITFIITYLGVNIISYIFAKTNQEYDFVIRPRIFVLVAIVIDYVFRYSTTPLIFLISNTLMAIFILIGIKKLYKL